MITLTLHWWQIPIALALSALVAWYLGSKEYGMFGGINHFFVGCGLMFGVLVALIMGLIK